MVRLRRTPCGSQTAGVQIAEFALILPLLLTMAVAVMDFGTAANMRQKLSNAAREGARFGATQPTFDVDRAGVTPHSTNAVSEVVFDYLVNAHVLPSAGQGSCAPSAANAFMSTDGTSTWTYVYSNCPYTLTIRINRNFTLGSTTQGTMLVGTKVEVDYPYQWQLGRFIGLIAPGSTQFSGATLLAGEAVMPNLY